MKLPLFSSPMFYVLAPQSLMTVHLSQGFLCSKESQKIKNNISNRLALTCCYNGGKDYDRIPSQHDNKQSWKDKAVSNKALSLA
jgi:hypothetical protein